MKENWLYGVENMPVHYPEEKIIQTIEPNPVEERGIEEIIQTALENPVGTEKLRDLVEPGKTAVVVIPDVTRAWSRVDLYLPYLIDELNKGGIKDEDILLLSATGTHREQTQEELKELVGEDIYKRIRVENHISDDADMHRYIGTTKRGTPVEVDKRALDADYLILGGEVSYHFLAGYSGGRKMVLPGIASRESVMTNHALAMNPGEDTGANPLACPGNMNETNPFHDDMLEAALMAKPDFIFNVAVDADNNIFTAVSGDMVKAHEEACKKVDAPYAIPYEKKADLVIASAGGFPKDINLYQSSKTLFNAKIPVNEGGTIIVLSKCSEGLGSPDIETMFLGYEDSKEREHALRKDFSIGAFVAYTMGKTAEDYKVILVSDLTEEEMGKTEFLLAKDFDEALELAGITEENWPDTILMPHAAVTFPIEK